RWPGRNSSLRFRVDSAQASYRTQGADMRWLRPPKDTLLTLREPQTIIHAVSAMVKGGLDRLGGQFWFHSVHFTTPGACRAFA
ncbi:MAG: hypothetical protein O7E53_01715, partial [Alphaproteobacteria bacterium]|nr:hypothetical protein [Alphaproteobacteria bacterium]